MAHALRTGWRKRLLVAPDRYSHARPAVVSFATAPLRAGDPLGVRRQALAIATRSGVLRAPADVKPVPVDGAVATDVQARASTSAEALGDD